MLQFYSSVNPRESVIRLTCPATWRVAIIVAGAALGLLLGVFESPFDYIQEGYSSITLSTLSDDLI
jgi:hypothetical protein